MEYAREPLKYEQWHHYPDHYLAETPGYYRWNDSPYTLWHPSSYWEHKRYSPDYSFDSPKTPLVSVSKYITIQPRGTDTNIRDQRMLLPITKKRKGNNRYGQSGSHRCLRCQKGKRKCVYASKDETCQRCLERGFTDCGEKLPTPRKQLALRQKLESGYLSRESDETASRRSSDKSPSPPSEERVAVLLPLPKNIDCVKPLTPGPNPEDEALFKLWKHLTI